MEACSTGNNGCYSQVRKRGKIYIFVRKKLRLILRSHLAINNLNIQAEKLPQFKWAVLKCKRVNQTNLTTLFKLQNVASLIPLIHVVSLTAQAAVIQRQRQIVT